MSTETTNAVVICKPCYGSGTIIKSEMTDYHKGEYDTWREVCKQCEGSGRLFETTEVTTVPFNPLNVPNEEEDDE